MDGPHPAGRLTTSFSLNRADFDARGGLETRGARTPAIAAEAMKGRPDWIHLQECARDQVATLDELLVRYTRLGKGGRGRQTWRNQDSRITMLEQVLLRAQPELDGDDKPYLVAAYTVDGHRGVIANFHLENEGTEVQLAQLAHVMRAALEMADAYDVPHGNVHITGDANHREAGPTLAAAGWVEGASATTTSWAGLRSTNGWGVTSTQGPRIDVDALGPGGHLVSYAQSLIDPPVADHNPHRVSYVLVP